jgi:beta-lactamase class A
LLGARVCKGAQTGLVEEWRRIASQSDGTVGAAALHLETGERVSLRGDERFPLASVCKLPMAMNILAMVDAGKLALDQQVEIMPGDVWHGVSEIAKRWPREKTFRLDEMVRLMVAQSDNTAEEALFRIGGGATAMAARFREWKVAGVRVDRRERQCDLDRSGVEGYPPPEQWTEPLLEGLIAKKTRAERYRALVASVRDPRDTGTPNGTVDLLARLFRGEALSKALTEKLIETLKSTTTGPMRLKGMLPSGTAVAHKTGLTGTIQGFTAGTNDSGVIFLPGGGRLAVSVYLKASTRNDEVRDRVIARVARAAFDRWNLPVPGK